MKLLVISHTTHKLDQYGVPVGWAPTCREIDFLAEDFEKVWHAAYLHPGIAGPAFSRYSSRKVQFVPLLPSGGHNTRDKLKVLFTASENLAIIRKYIRQADAVQLRLPTGMGVYLLPWITWKLKRTFKLWVKYAGNWDHPNPPITYRFQRWFISNNFQHSTVTINGKWKNQASHCLSFENPCLTNEEVWEGKLQSGRKNFDGPLRILFVGRLETEKGVDRIFDMLKYMKDTSGIGDVVLIGEGNLERYEAMAKMASVPVSIIGGLNRKELNAQYGSAHILILPSDSEGFPKVVAEAAAFGCVPIVSNISSIGQYINDSNGILLSSVDSKSIASEVDEVLKDRTLLKQKSINATSMADRFTYSYYNRRILKEVLALQG